MKAVFLHTGKESEKDTEGLSNWLNNVKKTIDGIKRSDMEVELRGCSDAIYPESEVFYWYSHPQIVVDMIKEARKAEREGFDAVIIGCVGQVEAEYAIKEALDIPVIGVGEACFLLAQVLGTNFSILTYSRKSAAWCDRILREYKLEDRCVSTRIANVTLDELFSGEHVKEIYEKMLCQAKKAVEEDRAEVIVSASTGVAGLADYLRERLDAAIVDATEAGVKIAEMLIDFKQKKNLYQSKAACYQASSDIAKYM